MQPSTSPLSVAWLAAAADLGLRVTAPVHIAAGDGGVAEFPALVHGFGGPGGALVCDSREIGRASAIGWPQGYFVSGLNADSYARYDRVLFQETLEDWGWFGNGEPPDWYTGVSPWG